MVRSGYDISQARAPPVPTRAHKKANFASTIDPSRNSQQNSEAAFAYPWLESVRLPQPCALLPEDILFHTGGWRG